MARLISIHSFRRGTGKTNLAVSLGAVMAMEGRRVGLIDTDFQSPSLHVLFNIDEDQLPCFLNDYMHRACEIEDTAFDVTGSLDSTLAGRMFLVPSNPSPTAIARILREGVEVDWLSAGYQRLVGSLELDVLLIDTHAGISSQSMASLAISNIVLIVFRLDHQDYQGTGILVELARKLKTDELILVVNDVAPPHDWQQVKEQAEQTYGAEVGAILPHSEELMTLGSHGVFALVYPDDPLTELFKTLASRLLQ